jgi:heat shock protein HslJ
MKPSSFFQQLACIAIGFLSSCTQPSPPQNPPPPLSSLRGTSWVLTRVESNAGNVLNLPEVSDPIPNAMQPLYGLSFSAQSDSISCKDNCNRGTILYTISSMSTIVFNFRFFTRIGCRDYSFDKYFDSLRIYQCTYTADSSQLNISYNAHRLVFRRVATLF